MDSVKAEAPSEKTDIVMGKYAYNVAVVFCYLIKDNKVLLIRRGKPPFSNEYTVVGGKKEFGEDLITACKREVYEETNLEVQKVNFRGVITNIAEGRDYETMAFYFTAHQFSGELKSSHEGEVAWCDINDSFHKEGISEYYLHISPFVFNQGGNFTGSTLIDKNGKIKSLNINQ